jgi:chromosome segregation ATPase
MEICWYCLAMVLMSTLAGALLMYLINKSGRRAIIEERDEYLRTSNHTKENLNKVTDEYNNYKAKASQSIEDKDAEINKLNKLNLSLSRTPRPKLTQAELDHKYLKWKKRSEDLSSELEYLKAKLDSPKSNATDSQSLEDMKSQLATALKKIRRQELQLKEAQIGGKSTGKGKGKKKKKIKKLQSELRALKSKLNLKSKKKN